MDFYNHFKQIFGDQLLEVFCPPYNNINNDLEKKLNESGLVISSANTPQTPACIYNVDYDFCDWSIHKLKPKEQIINELCARVESGAQTIGINSHHLRLSFEDGDFSFFDKLFSIINESQKIRWINPFASKNIIIDLPKKE